MSRNIYLDSIKGIAIFLVVFGHCIQWGSGTTYLTEGMFWENPIYRCIYSFHMPLFALVSGYLMFPSIHKRTVLGYVKKQLLGIGVPLLSWAVIRWSYSIVAGNIVVGGGKILITSLFNEAMGGLWFLRVLLVCSSIIAVVALFIKENKWKLVVFTVIQIGLLFIPDYYKYDRVAYLFPYFVIGYFAFIAPHKIKVYMSSWYFVALSGALFTVLFYFFKSEYIYSYCPQATYIFRNGNGIQEVFGQMYINCYRWAIGLAGCVFVISFGRKVFKNKKNIISMVGRYTLAIYIVSDMLNGTALYLLTKKCYFNVGQCFLESIIMIALCMGFSYLVGKNKYLNGLLLGGH